jgi:hypothetical protein
MTAASPTGSTRDDERHEDGDEKVERHGRNHGAGAKLFVAQNRARQSRRRGFRRVVREAIYAALHPPPGA